MSMTIQGVGGNAHISGFGNVKLLTYNNPPTIVNNQPHFSQPDSCITLMHVALVEESPINLISLSTWTDSYPSYMIIISRDQMMFWDNANATPNGSRQFTLAKKVGERKSGNSWYLMATTDPLQYLFVARMLCDWHIILGHADPRNLLHLQTAHLSKGFTINQSNKLPIDTHFNCIGCIQGKAHICPFGESHVDTPHEIGDLIYSDVWGPTSVASLQGNSYYIIFINTATRFRFIHFMRHKSKAVE
ncbi:Copia-like polyprotein/retrotransposon [Ceratobasidium theobromae]|uniref:Copia-like polyprotein/retrotransposon n=1 Tax=Ceratobasidium theobromae TaxID=1582974 RepID=A0A5N5QBA6_9AGAM|nr:Copia-like polyprotein/retrotransposon [Ceratobasidium theobromae]